MEVLGTGLNIRGYVQVSAIVMSVQLFQVCVCVYACMHALPGQNGSKSADYLMKSLSFWVGREVDALH